MDPVPSETQAPQPPADDSANLLPAISIACTLAVVVVLVLTVPVLRWVFAVLFAAAFVKSLLYILAARAAAKDPDESEAQGLRRSSDAKAGRQPFS